MNKSNLPQTLVVITKNRVVDIMRKRISEQARIDKSAVLNRYPPEEPLIPESELHECLNKLNEKERMLTDLFFLQSKSYAEISKLTNIPTNSIGPTLKRALIKLQPIVQKLLND
jgi:RNA polymerase sigma-70 factor (ECF subfamily)